MSQPAFNLDNLTPEERLRLIEQIWESLRAQPDQVPLTRAQRAELDRRLDDLDRGDIEGIPWDEVLARLHTRCLDPENA